LKIGIWVLLAILFLGLGVFKLTQDEVSRTDLIHKNGVIESVSCNSGCKDGSPTVVLQSNGSSSSYKVFEEFSTRTNCEDQKQSLIGRSVTISVLPNDDSFAMAYDFSLDDTLIFSLGDVLSSDKETAYTLFMVSIVMLLSLLWNRKKDT